LRARRFGAPRVSCEGVDERLELSFVVACTLREAPRGVAEMGQFVGVEGK
jgi:hypothetical protein